MKEAPRTKAVRANDNNAILERITFGGANIFYEVNKMNDYFMKWRVQATYRTISRDLTAPILIHQGRPRRSPAALRPIG